MPNMPARLAITSYSRPPDFSRSIKPRLVRRQAHHLLNQLPLPVQAETFSSSKKLQPAPVLADLADLAHGAHGALVLGVVLGPVERALLEGGAAVDGRVAGRADLKLGELVKLNLDRVVRVALALRLGLAGLLFC